ncbi:TetR/AcrR family transcriptional regulator [Nocardia huaxiensis]|uniref:TetR/AcrR family transcriptional regulator n=1 Tax=Nocardia huaxiensis TaxID=2755382 RepID=A0A7D6VBI1_9NOCA|nr:TetR/AcrR family transcriptional regulator [Nocardia huaxiensis]QLY28255.1 TetR/AcrR family transcriptional regulator [Nocardia huaxiensis]UFS98310.1 TetR/AcrR family transcriptional regulator [Nocardia huaxiensis]
MARAPLGRQQLLDAARAELLDGNGVVDLHALKRRSGLSTGALYHHFGSKAGLLVAVYEEFHRGLVAAIADDTLPAGGHWGDRERVRTRHFVAYHFGDPLAELLLSRIVMEPEVAELEAGALARLTASAGRNIRQGQRDGDIDAAIDPELAGACIIGALKYGIADLLRRDPRPSVDDASARLWNVIEGALTSR